jgi:hypothetical protein
MAAVTGPGYAYPPPQKPAPTGRRWWVAALVAGWTVALTAAVYWSAGHDPATVPEQRSIGQAVPEVRRAAGALVAAAQDERWVLRIGALRIEDCSLNPVWKGRQASRELVVYVPEGDARAALDGIAAGLPEGYDAGVAAARGGTRLSFQADAGELIAIGAEALATDQVLRLRVESGCRPPDGPVEEADPVAGETPEAVRKLGVAPEVYAVSCPGGGTAATFEAEGGEADPESEPSGLPAGTAPVWAEPGGWAYRTGSDSVVASTEGGRLVLSVTTACGPR